MAQSAKPDRHNLQFRFYRRKIGPTVTVAYTDSAVRTSAALEVGSYRLTCTTACHVAQGASDVAATTGDCPVAAGGEIWTSVDTCDEGSTWEGVDDNWISAIRQTVNGTLYISLMNRLTAAE